MEGVREGGRRAVAGEEVLEGEQDLGRQLEEAEGGEGEQQGDVQIEFCRVFQCQLLVTEELVELSDVLNFEL